MHRAAACDEAERREDFATENKSGGACLAASAPPERIV
jgi:hypothetical protein